MKNNLNDYDNHLTDGIKTEGFYNKIIYRVTAISINVHVTTKHSKM